ncbi:MAG TPA: hypothetical protein PLU10_08855 [Chitinophagaceae bacterium]|nr:hypothetical protein [Chitinophagaceae bacterium]
MVIIKKQYFPTCSEKCGIIEAEIPKPGDNCKPQLRKRKWKGLALLACQTTDGTVTSLPAWSANTATKTAWLTAMLPAMTALHLLRNMVIAPPETTDVKILASFPASPIATKQVVTIEDVVLQTTSTDTNLDFTLWRYMKNNITRLNIIGIDSENNFYPFVDDFELPAPEFLRANGKFWTEDETVGECLSLLVKKAEIYVCGEIEQFATPWIKGADIPSAVLEALLP